MCGRFADFQRPDAVMAALGLGSDVPREASYNIVPSARVRVVRTDPGSGRREMARLRWGLVPSWAKDPRIGAKLINARSETVSEKPSFRSALKSRRCLILMDGFYEWQRSVKPSRPWYFRMKDRATFTVAGLWERREREGEETLETCCMLTTRANSLMRKVHHRMPVILAGAQRDLWLDPAVRDPAVLEPLYAPLSARLMQAHPVSTIVNNPRNDGPRCVEPAAEDAVRRGWRVAE